MEEEEERFLTGPVWDLAVAWQMGSLIELGFWIEIGNETNEFCFLLEEEEEGKGVSF